MAISDSNSTRCGRPAQLDVRIPRGQELVREICKVCWVHQVFDTLMNELSITERASQTCTCKLPSKVKTVRVCNGVRLPGVFATVSREGGFLGSG